MALEDSLLRMGNIESVEGSASLGHLEMSRALVVEALKRDECNETCWDQQMSRALVVEALKRNECATRLVGINKCREH
jgi:hypothetical protein